MYLAINLKKRLLVFTLPDCALAQTQIVFTRQDPGSGAERSYPIPREMTFTFRDRRVITREVYRVTGDTIRYERSFPQMDTFCLYSELSEIEIRKRNEGVMEGVAAISGIGAALMIYATAKGIAAGSSDAGDPTPFLSIFFGIPVSVNLTGLALGFFAASRTPAFETGKWTVRTR